MEKQEKQAKAAHRKKLGAERVKKYRTNKEMQEASTAEDRDSSVLDVNTALMCEANTMAALNNMVIPDAAKVSCAGKGRMETELKQNLRRCCTVRCCEDELLSPLHLMPYQ